MAEYLIVRESIVMPMQKYIRKTINESNSQFIVRSINRKTWVPKDIINPVEDIRIITSSFQDIRLENCNRRRRCNVKRLHTSNPSCTVLYFLFTRINPLSLLQEKNKQKQY